MKITIKYFNKEIEPLRYIDGKSDWIDLRCAADMEIKQGEMKLVPLGVGMILPEGYEAYVVARSSTFKNFGILQAYAFGIVDETYSGDNDQWFFPAYATKDVTLHVNDRICQFRIEKHQPSLEFEEVDHLNAQNRGGFGTTGIQ